jgi:hypothetical protein
VQEGQKRWKRQGIESEWRRRFCHQNENRAINPRKIKAVEENKKQNINLYERSMA